MVVMVFMASAILQGKAIKLKLCELIIKILYDIETFIQT